MSLERVDSALTERFCQAGRMRRKATAAHCAKAVAKQDVRVVAGREDKRTDDGQVLGVSKVWISKGYNDPTQGNDVAVLTVRGQLDYRPATASENGER